MRRALATFLLLTLCAAGWTGSASAATYVVTATGDQADQVLNNGQCLTSAGTCTLRAALQEVSNSAGPHTIRFAIPTAGVATINVGTTLPTVNRQTLIDGSSQTTSASGDTNPVMLGSGGTVGTDALALAQVAGPEIEIRDNSAGGLATGLAVTASNVEIRGLSIHGFGNGVGNGDIVLSGATTGVSIHDNVIGSGPTAIALPATATHQTAGSGIVVNAPDQGTIAHNVVAYTGQFGVRLLGGAANWSIAGNEIVGVGRVSGAANGVSFEATGTTGNVVNGSRIAGSGGSGVDILIGPNRITNTTLVGNGVFAPLAATTETAGVRVQGTGSTVNRNVIDANYGAGVLVVAATNQANWITRNAVLRNGTVTNRAGAGPTNQIGIDLLATGATGAALVQGTAPFVTVNDLGDADTGGNLLTNFPVLSTATLTPSGLTVTGFARPGAVVELFIGDADASGFGEGASYLGTFVEGSGNDTDATAGSYAGPINGLNQGSDATERFSVTLPLASLPPSVANGTRLTATATVGNATSEFSGLVTIAAPPPMADLSITATAAPNPALIGQVVTWVYSITNLGPDPAPGTTLTGVLPPGMRVQTVTSSQGTCTTSVACALGTLQPGQKAIVTVAASADALGTQVTTAQVSTSITDPVASNNSVSTSTTVTPSTPLVGTPHATLRLDTSRESSTPGREFITFTATIVNAGTAPSSTSDLTITLSSGTVRALLADGPCRVTNSGATRTATCQTPPLAVGGRATVAVIVQPAATARPIARATLAGGGVTAGPVAPSMGQGSERLRIAIASPRRTRTNQLVPVAITVTNPTARLARAVTVTFAPPVAAPTGPVDLRTVFARARVPSSQTTTYSLGDIAPGGRSVVSLNVFTGRKAVARRLAAAVIALDGSNGSQTAATMTVRGTVSAPAVTG